MNFFREVVDIVNENEAIDSRKNIIKIMDEITKFQCKIRKYIDDQNLEFLPNLINNQLYLDQGKKLLEDVANFKNHIEETQNNLINTTEEMEQTVNELREIGLTLQTSYTLLAIDDLFQQVDDAKSKQKYIKILPLLNGIKSHMNDPDNVILKDLDCFKNIKIKAIVETEELLYNLTEQFQVLVNFNEKTFKKTKCITLKISKDEDSLHDTIIALFNCKYNPRHKWDFLFNNMFEPIISRPVSIEFDERDDYVTLVLSFSIEPLANDLKPNYKIVFENIEMVIKCLAFMNISISDEQCVLSLFGDYGKEKLLNLLKNECLAYALPDTIDEMNESPLVADVLAFNQFLCDMLFFKEDDSELVDFANSIVILFRNRFCTKILDRAIEIMRYDLQDMVSVHETEVPKVFSDSYAIFPKCKVSKSVLELTNLLDKVRHQSSIAKDELNSSLQSTIPMIFERYIIEVPKYHANVLQTIPQQTALFHNNCMFLAYWMTKNASKEIDLLNGVIQSVRECGSNHFSHQIGIQREQLMDILKDFDLIGVTNELDTKSQKVIRQCLRQLDLLKNVWHTILPDIVYNKSMANILNDFCSEIIARILIVEDISSTVSKGLTDICDIIIERCPYLFEDHLQISILVKSWTKLTQLRTILSAPLAHITDLWSEGKGPLTLHYKADEIKHLIRALFQNTDRRANALSLII